MRWDIFCKVIDNFGDIGVCWRLSADLAARGHQVRLWLDDASALEWMAPGAKEGNWTGVQVLPWTAAQDPVLLGTMPPAGVWVEGFGCELAPEFIAASAISAGATGHNDSQSPVWINLEYLSAEGYVERSHALPSPVMQGPAKGRTKHFFYPGFTHRTGGLLREPDYLARQTAFDTTSQKAWLAGHGIAWSGERLVSLFCYEPAALRALLMDMAGGDTPTLLLVTPGRAMHALSAAWSALGWGQTAAWSHGALRCQPLPALPQRSFDELLWVCDLNFVRGEDSLVRAIWAGKPWVWHIYPQDDTAHADKLHALLDLTQAPASLRLAHQAWNGLSLSVIGTEEPVDWCSLPLESWAQTANALRAKLLQMSDLTTQLIDFVAKKS